MKKVTYAPAAEADVYAIAKHIAEERSLAAAYRFIDTIRRESPPVFLNHHDRRLAETQARKRGFVHVERFLEAVLRNGLHAGAEKRRDVASLSRRNRTR